MKNILVLTAFLTITNVQAQEITAFYGDVIKLKHNVTGQHLHSHNLIYEHSGASRQQQVTAFGGSDDNDYWLIKNAHDGGRYGRTVYHNDVIRLEHYLTRRNLHSHAGYPSPVTKQQEVTAYGTNGVGDPNDNWRVEVEGGGQMTSGKRVRFIHVNTNHALHSHAGYACPPTGQQEVTAYSGRDDNDFWKLSETMNSQFNTYVSLGRTLKLKHNVTLNKLHSHDAIYGHTGGSRQQQVTAFGGADDNDFWTVRGAHGTSAAGSRQPIRHNDIIRMEHMMTRRNLHSHAGFPSPVTNQQEVTAYGSAGVGDPNDNWRVEIEDGGIWRVGKRIRLVHVNTNHALHSHAGYSHPQWTIGQQEVTAYSGRDDNDFWSWLQFR